MDKSLRESYVKAAAPALISALQESSREKFGTDRQQATVAMFDVIGTVYSGLFNVALSDATTQDERHALAAALIQRLAGFLSVTAPDLKIQFRLLSNMDPEEPDV